MVELVVAGMVTAAVEVVVRLWADWPTLVPSAATSP